MIEKTGVVEITDDGIVAKGFHINGNAHGGSLAFGFAGCQEDVLQWIELKIAEARTIKKKMDHIKVELDFIPVEERLPTDVRVKFVLGSTVCHEPLKAWLSGGAEPQWMDLTTGRHRRGVTHWAEIPKIG